MNLKRYAVKIGGESGQGINSIGEILGKSLKSTGFYVFGYREYPSLIKGGFSSYQLDFSDLEIKSTSKSCDLLVCISRVSTFAYLKTLRSNGTLIHNLKQLNFSEEDQSFISENNIKVHYVDTDELITSIGAKKIMANTVILGIVCGLLGIDFKVTADILSIIINKSAEVLKQNQDCLQLGYDYVAKNNISITQFEFQKQESIKDGLLISGNESLGLGAYAGGVRSFFAYPMTPSSSILTYLSEIKGETKMLVRQVDDEITAAQMMIGAMFMGTRSLTATSGGGFDLMTESLSLSGMSETPAVFILGQRPGPSTGLPTWTAQGDINLAVYSGHGEFPRCVLSISDAADAYLIIQKAFNIAERFQIPVIVLTEKQIAESLFYVSKFGENLPIERGLSGSTEFNSSDRFKYSESGISERWLPGQSNSTYVGNSDEHGEDGSLTEESDVVHKMYSKRMKKLDTLKAEITEPEFFGDENAEIIFVGFGSTKNVMIDAMNLADKRIGYLHYEYIYPLKTDKFMSLSGKRVVIMENNYTAQLGKLITQETGYIFKEQFVKFDGRPFFVEDVLNFVGESKEEKFLFSQRLKSLVNH